MRKMPAWSERCPQCKGWWSDRAPWFYQPKANLTREEMLVLSILLQLPITLGLYYVFGGLFWASIFTEAFSAGIRYMMGSEILSYIAPTTRYCATLLNFDILLGLYIWLSAPLSFFVQDLQRVGLTLCIGQALLCCPVLLEVAQRLWRVRQRPRVDGGANTMPSIELLELWKWPTRFKQLYLAPCLVDVFALWRRDLQVDRALERLRSNIAAADQLEFPESGEPERLARKLSWLPFPQLSLVSSMLCTAAATLAVVYWTL
jgi:hypothetical protein